MSSIKRVVDKAYKYDLFEAQEVKQLRELVEDYLKFVEHLHGRDIDSAMDHAKKTLWRISRYKIARKEKRVSRIERKLVSSNKKALRSIIAVKNTNPSTLAELSRTRKEMAVYNATALANLPFPNGAIAKALQEDPLDYDKIRDLLEESTTALDNLILLYSNLKKNFVFY